MAKVPKQIEPAFDPNPPVGDKIFSYYILTEPASPSAAPPNALDKVQYQRQGEYVQQFLHDDPANFIRPWGYVTYDHELTFNEIYQYNLYHFDPVKRSLYDTWILLGRDTAKMRTFFTHFFKAIEGDPEMHRLRLAIRLVGQDWTLAKVRSEIKDIK